MKIKLHNSLGKFNTEIEKWFLFDEEIFVRSYGNHLYLTYRIDDNHYFLKFSYKTKEFEEWHGFGHNVKTFKPKWWKDPIHRWKDI